MKKRLAIVHKDVGGFGGIEGQIEILAKGLKRREWEIFLLTDQTDSLLARRLKGSVCLERVDLKHLIKAGRSIACFAEKNQIPIIESHMFRTSFACRYAKCCDKNLIHLFRIHTYIDCARIPEWKKLLYHAAAWRTDFLVTEYISINVFNIAEMVRRSRLRRSKISLVEDAVRQRGLPEDPCEWEWPSFRIAMVANFNPGKGHSVLIRGIEELKKKGIIVYARIIGGEHGGRTVLTEQLKEMARACDVESQIEFYGFCEDIYDALEGIPIVVLPSDSEGTPNCVLEAMALKKVVICSDVGGVGEFLEDGVNGFIHKSHSPTAFAKALERVMRLPKDQVISICENAYVTWEKRYQSSYMVNGMEQIYMRYTEETGEIV